MAAIEKLIQEIKEYKEKLPVLPVCSIAGWETRHVHYCDWVRSNLLAERYSPGTIDLSELVRQLGEIVDFTTTVRLERPSYDEAERVQDKAIKETVLWLQGKIQEFLRGV